MNKYTALDISYLKPSRTLETILLESNSEQRIIYVYNYEGIHFRVFDLITDILLFFDDKFDSEISFNSEEELGNYFANLNLKSISKTSTLLR